MCRTPIGQRAIIRTLASRNWHGRSAYHPIQSARTLRVHCWPLCVDSYHCKFRFEGWSRSLQVEHERILPGTKTAPRKLGCLLESCIRKGSLFLTCEGQQWDKEKQAQQPKDAHHEMVCRSRENGPSTLIFSCFLIKSLTWSKRQPKMFSGKLGFHTNS